VSSVALGDERLGFMLPSRPLPEPYDLALRLSRGDGKPYEVRVGLDPNNGQLTAR